MTGTCLGAAGDTLVTVNWRSKMITEMNLKTGKTLLSFTGQELVEPIAVCVNSLTGDIFVSDNGLGAVMVFDKSGELKKKISPAPPLTMIEMSALASTTDHLIVADTKILVFDMETGKLIKQIGGDGKETLKAKANVKKGRYCGLTETEEGLIISARVDKSGGVVKIFDQESGAETSVIDSWGHKLRRPTSVCAGVKNSEFLYVVDIGSDCVRKYRFK